MQTRNPHGYHRSAQFCASSLLLHRENYLKEDREFRDRFRELARSLSAAEVLSLLRAADWREAIVGAYSVLALRLHAFTAEVVDQLRRRRFPLLTRPLCLALAVLGGSEAENAVIDFLHGPFQHDALDDYAAALEALQALAPPAWEMVAGPVLGRVAQDPCGEEIAFAESRSRFAAALRYWSE
ncbi:MAG TPA: DUF6000 family protein [Gemmataceae bacterium]|nr:DUF6000 family protein [Gemmataceae bacterium]